MVLLKIGDDVSMGQNGPLWNARGAAGVLQEGYVFRSNRLGSPGKGYSLSQRVPKRDRGQGSNKGDTFME